MQKILIIQTAFIGDVILATALPEKLHRFFPEAKIDFLLRKGNESLLKQHPWLHEILIWDKKSQKKKNLWRLLKKIRKTKYDLVINLQRFASTGILTAFSGAKDKRGFDKNPLSFLYDRKVAHSMLNGHHEVERNHKLIADLTDETFARPKLYPSEEDQKNVEQYQSSPYVCIAPASVWFTKQYPKEKWIELIDRVPDTFKIFLIGSKHDEELCSEIINQTKNKNIFSLAGKLNFLQSAALMKSATMNYTNDSAPLHIASAVNAPVTAIYCSTIPEFGFYPLSDKSTVLQTLVPLKCKPCGLHGLKACPMGHFNCAHTIEVKYLLDPLMAYEKI